MTLFFSANDQALINLTGFDHLAFNYMLEKFKPLYAFYSPYSCNGMIKKIQRKSRRPRSFTDIQCLGFVLAWGRTRGSMMVLCIMFGITASVCYPFLRFCRRLLLRALRNDGNAAIRMRTGLEIETF